MLKINFYPERDDENLIKAAGEYQEVWNKESEKILNSIYKVAGLKPKSRVINSLICAYTNSYAYPLVLRDSYPKDIKTGTLIHELMHRLIKIADNSHYKKNPLEQHKDLYLVLYDIWVDLYGEEFAEENRLAESDRKPYYKEAFDWALSMSVEERKEMFRKYLVKVKK